MGVGGGQGEQEGVMIIFSKGSKLLLEQLSFSNLLQWLLLKGHLSFPVNIYRV